ncbi:non-ribosomal peptide synthetase [Sesbania bispinosa]|nr:non-ribosomal peptide synthetase [Sesbania bispinosa]
MVTVISLNYQNFGKPKSKELKRTPYSFLTGKNPSRSASVCSSPLSAAVRATLLDLRLRDSDAASVVLSGRLLSVSTSNQVRYLFPVSYEIIQY